jgi:hypothetical protein
MHAAHTDDIMEKLDALRTELADLAFTLDRRGRPDAADVALSVSARVGELRDEIDAAGVSTETDSVQTRC